MSDLDMIQGAWRIVYAESNGAVIPPDQYQDVKIEITGNIGNETAGTDSMTVQFVLQPADVPKAIDSTYLDGPQKGFTSLGSQGRKRSRQRRARGSQWLCGIGQRT